jgi:hypothetical protein
MEDWVGGVNGAPGWWRDRHNLMDRFGDGSASLSVQGKASQRCERTEMELASAK